MIGWNEEKPAQVKSVQIDAELHQVLKIEAARRNLPLYELIEKTLWDMMGGKK